MSNWTWVSFEQEELEDYFDETMTDSLYFEPDEIMDVNFYAMSRAEDRAKWIAETIIRDKK